jgi:hypothetical protein
MSLYDQPLTVTLTVAEWLEVQCALSDAWSHNNDCGFPEHARRIVRLKRRIEAQSGAAIDAASAQIAA